MCGIWGIISKNSRLTAKDVNKIIPNMMVAGNLRGTDGCGIFSVHKVHATKPADDFIAHQSLKRAQNSFHLWYDKRFDDYLKAIDKDACIVFGHNRAATRGKMSDENTHPFETENLILIHNGTVSYGLGDYNKKHEVDSGGLALMIDEKGIHYAAENVDMAYALVWYDKRDETLHFCRNKDRPLWVAETNTGYYYASEKLMLEWILGRHEITILKIMEIPVLKHFIVDVATGELTYEDLPAKKTYTTVGYGTYSNTTDGSKTSDEDTVGRFKSLARYLNQDVDFYITSCKDVGSQKREMYQYRGYSISATNAVIFRTKSKAFQNFLTSGTFRGTVTSIEKVDGTIALIVRTKTIKQKPSSPNARIPDFSDIENDDFVDEDVIEMGDGTLLTVGTFHKKAEHGCAHCQAKLPIKDVEVMSRAPDGNILCGHCTAEAICDSEAFLEKFHQSRVVH